MKYQALFSWKIKKRKKKKRKKVLKMSSAVAVKVSTRVDPIQDHMTFSWINYKHKWLKWVVFLNKTWSFLNL